MQVGILGLLFLVFLILKLCGVIAWSWWLVTLPLYGGFLLALVCIIGAAIFLAKAGHL